MNKTAEQFTATANENLLVLQERIAQAHEHAAKLMELNLTTTKSLMTESFEYAKAMMEAKDPQSFAAVYAKLAKPMSEIATDYAHDFHKIMDSASNEFTMAAQARMAEVRLGFASMIENASPEVGFGEFKQAFADGQKVLDEATSPKHQDVKKGRHPSKVA